MNLVPNGTGTVDVASKKITNVAMPTAATDAATKAYVDAAVASGAIPTMISAEAAGTYSLPNAQAYCRALNAPCERTSENLACDAIAYSDWRLPSAEELGVFLGINTGVNAYWTTSASADGGGAGYIMIVPTSGNIFWVSYAYAGRVRCVR